MESKKVKDLRDIKNLFVGLTIMLGFLFLFSLTVLVLQSSTKYSLDFYEIIEEPFQVEEQYVDEQGYVKANITAEGVHKYKGNKITPACECFEEVCPAGSRWMDGSKVCFKQNKIVDGIGCKAYLCEDYIVGMEEAN